MADRRFAPDFEAEELTRRIIGAAIEVHRELGPGLLESSYEQCLWQELIDLGVPVQRQVELPIRYKGRELDCGYRIDLLVEDIVVIELKSVENILRIHEAQLMTYLRLGPFPVGLLLNSNVPVLRDGIVRRALTRPPSALSALSASSAVNKESKE
ncbi:MAG: GxxExxY protein [Phycisphaerales bacterium]|nr:GxxExxY protein [Phycisphaerales bacterium]